MREMNPSYVDLIWRIEEHHIDDEAISAYKRLFENTYKCKYV